MTGLFGRLTRLELVAGLGLLALPLMGNARALTTQTTLATETRDTNGQTQATLSISVQGEDGLPAAGAVVILDKGKPLAGVALNSDGHATSVLTLSPGEHNLTASYAGDTAHLTSISQANPVRAATGSTPDFAVAVAPATISLAQGQSGSVTATVTPINAASLTAPMFVTLSCSGLPDQSACTFTPENLEILPSTSAGVPSVMVLSTKSSNTVYAAPLRRVSNPVALAVLFPGALGLIGVAFGARRSAAWLSRTALLGLVGLVAVMGTTACNPLYQYKNHGPSPNLPTPVGTYTLLVTAQSSNGVTATTHSTTMALTVTK